MNEYHKTLAEKLKTAQAIRAAAGLPVDHCERCDGPVVLGYGGYLWCAASCENKSDDDAQCGLQGEHVCVLLPGHEGAHERVVVSRVAFGNGAHSTAPTTEEVRDLAVRASVMSDPESLGRATALEDIAVPLAEQRDAAVTRAEAAEREAERLRHGAPVEGDWVCPNALEVDKLRGQLADALHDDKARELVMLRGIYEEAMEGFSKTSCALIKAERERDEWQRINTEIVATNKELRDKALNYGRMASRQASAQAVVMAGAEALTARVEAAERRLHDMHDALSPLSADTTEEARLRVLLADYIAECSSREEEINDLRERCAALEALVEEQRAKRRP